MIRLCENDRVLLQSQFLHNGASAGTRIPGAFLLNGSAAAL
jgi:hypothetical protein